MGRARASRVSVAIVLLSMATGCASEFDRRFAEADQRRAEADRAGAEWLETGKLLEQARELADAGDHDAALSLVEQARFQAEAAIRQAEREAEAWRDRVVK